MNYLIGILIGAALLNAAYGDITHKYEVGECVQPLDHFGEPSKTYYKIIKTNDRYYRVNVCNVENGCQWTFEFTKNELDNKFDYKKVSCP